MLFPPIKKVMLFGGAPLLVATAELVRAKRLALSIYTAPRQENERLDESGTTLGAALAAKNLSYTVSEDVNAEPHLLDEITEQTLGIGFGEAWPFSKTIIARFNGRLIDFMGIPHPRYRGGAHYTWMILRGDRTGGCNLQVVNEEMIQGEFDSGAILKSSTYQFPSTARTPADYFRAAVAEEVTFIKEFLDEVKAGKNFQPRPPDEAKSEFYPRLNTMTHGWIDWAWGGHAIERFICAFDEPYVGASSQINGVRVHLKGARLKPTKIPFHPFQSGLVIRRSTGETVITTDGGELHVKSIGSTDGKTPDFKVGDRFVSDPSDLAKVRLTRARYGSRA